MPAAGASRNGQMAVPDGTDAERLSRGALIVLEGLDRSGKSTQCAKLVEVLRARLGCTDAVEHWRFPDRSTAVGQEIAAYLATEKELDDREIHRLFSRNRWEKRDKMLELMRRGTTLIVDRYAYSGAAYSAAKGLDLQECKVVDAGLPAPDLVIFLKVNPEAAAARGGYGGERYEKMDFQRKVAEQFERLEDSSWRVIDASLNEADVHEKVSSLVWEVVEGCRNTSKATPWPPPLWARDSKRKD